MSNQLDRIENKVNKLLLLGYLTTGKEYQIMALGQDILNAVTEENTAVDSFIALVQGLIDNNTIPADVGAKILSAVSSEKDKVNAAIVANTPPAPPTP